jgi:hypothetical protein
MQRSLAHPNVHTFFWFNQNDAGEEDEDARYEKGPQVNDKCYA